MNETPAARTATPARTAYLVLGMHRSGTSAVTQLLALAGAQLPDNVMPGDEHNAKGYFEPWKIAMFNDARLRAGGSAWDDPFAFPFQALPGDQERDWRQRAVALFDEEFKRARYPLLKDPRVTVLAPFWRAVLDELDVGARCVIPVRHPLAVAGSLARRDGFPPAKSVLVWTSYMLAAEAYSRDLPRAFVDYDGLLSDWRAEVARMETALGGSLPKMTDRAAVQIDRFLTPDLRHNAGQGELAALGWPGEIAQQVFDWFAGASRGESPDRAPLAAAAARLAEKQSQMGFLVSSMTRDLDAARHDLLEARQRLAFFEGVIAEYYQVRDQLEAILGRS